MGLVQRIVFQSGEGIVERVFEDVVVFAQRTKIVVTGAAFGVAIAVVEVTFGGWSRAAEEHATLVT